MKESVHYDEFEPFWGELIIFEKKSEKNLKFFFSYFQKKRSQLLWIEWKCPLWWIFEKKKKKSNFFFLWGTKGRKSNSYGPPKEKIWNFFSSTIFRKKSLNCSGLKESVHYDEFEHIWDEFDNFWKKKSENFFFSYFQKKGLNCSELQESVHYHEFEHKWDELIVFEKKNIKFFFFLWGTEGRKSNSYGPPKEKICIFFLNYFQKKGLNCSELKESVHYDEFEHIWDEFDNFWKKNLKFFFSTFFRKKVSIALNFKVHIFWEGHKILRNLHLNFDCMYCSQK